MSISLEKGQRISLEKNGQRLDKVCVGVNWGAMQKKGLFGGMKTVSIDLDASVGLFTENKDLVDTIFYGKLANANNAIVHSGDDLTGDVGGDDGLDNEIITINLANVPGNVATVAVVLNSFTGHDFATIPFASVRLYEGTPTRVDTVLAQYNIGNDDKYKGHVSMVLGLIYRNQNGWKFKALGEPTKDKKLKNTLKTVAASFL